MKVGSSGHFEAVGLDRKNWSTASPIRTIFKNAFVGANLEYFNPHSFRNTLVKFGLENCKSAEHFKAWSQNLGHDKVLTTFTHYGEVTSERQREIIRDLSVPSLSATQQVTIDLADAILKRIDETGLTV